MDIHKPKAAHSIREFLIEIGTIVCGILIALGLEQGIEYVHHRAAEMDARAAIEGEMARNVGYLLQREKQKDCIPARLGELRVRLSAVIDGQQWRKPGWVGRPGNWTMEDTRWQAITKGGIAAMLSAREIERYSYLQSRFPTILAEETVEQTDWAELRSLENIGRLDLPTAAHYQAVLRDAAFRAWRIRTLTAQAEVEVKQLGLEVKANERPMSNSPCFPIDTTPDQAAQMNKAAGYPYGEP